MFNSVTITIISFSSKTLFPPTDYRHEAYNPTANRQQILPGRGAGGESPRCQIQNLQGTGIQTENKPSLAE